MKIFSDEKSGGVADRMYCQISQKCNNGPTNHCHCCPDNGNVDATKIIIKDKKKIKDNGNVGTTKLFKEIQIQIQLQQQVQIKTQVAGQDISCRVFAQSEIAKVSFCGCLQFPHFWLSLFSTPAKHFDTFRIQDFSFRRDQIDRISTSDQGRFFAISAPYPIGCCNVSVEKINFLKMIYIWPHNQKVLQQNCPSLVNLGQFLAVLIVLKYPTLPNLLPVLALK